MSLISTIAAMFKSSDPGQDQRRRKAMFEIEMLEKFNSQVRVLEEDIRGVLESYVPNLDYAKIDSVTIPPGAYETIDRAMTAIALIRRDIFHLPQYQGKAPTILSYRNAHGSIHIKKG